MPAIAQLGTEVLVTPGDEIQIVSGPGESVVLDDRSPFSLKVEGLLENSGEVIGVYGEVISGHQRYLDQVATLLIRLDHSDWRRDNRSAAQFKVGRSVARPNGKYPFYHPDGTDIQGFPYYIRYGSIDSRRGGEPAVNSALMALPEPQFER